jgi:hypothetical protein
MLPERWELHVKKGMIFINWLKPIVVFCIIDGGKLFIFKVEEKRDHATREAKCIIYKKNCASPPFAPLGNWGKEKKGQASLCAYSFIRISLLLS